MRRLTASNLRKLDNAASGDKNLKFSRINTRIIVINKAKPLGRGGGELGDDFEGVAVGVGDGGEDVVDYLLVEQTVVGE